MNTRETWLLPNGKRVYGEEIEEGTEVIHTVHGSMYSAGQTKVTQGPLKWNHYRWTIQQENGTLAHPDLDKGTLKKL